MLKVLLNQFVARMERQWRYDAGYMHRMIDISTGAALKFAVVTSLVERRAAPPEALAAAGLAGTLAEDCGPCTQLCVDMALEAGMARDQIEAVLRRDLKAMSPDVALGFQFADAVVRHSADDDVYRHAVRARWGEKGVIDLAMGLQMGRLFPMMKLALGYARECRRVSVAGHQVDVIKQAA